MLKQRRVPLARPSLGCDLSPRILKVARRKKLYGVLETKDAVRFLLDCAAAHTDGHTTPRQALGGSGGGGGSGEVAVGVPSTAKRAARRCRCVNAPTGASRPAAA